MYTYIAIVNINHRIICYVNANDEDEVNKKLLTKYPRIPPAYWFVHKVDTKTPNTIEILHKYPQET